MQRQEHTVSDQSQPNPVEHNADAEVKPQSGHPSQAEGEDVDSADASSDA